MRSGKEVKYPVSGQTIDRNGQKYAHEVIESGQYTYGDYNKKFAKALAKYVGQRYAVLVNSGSSANLLAISALTSEKLGKRQLHYGDHVVTTALNFPTTINALVRNNLVPVFIDVHLRTYNAEMSQLERALNNYPIKAIFLTHILGNPVDLREVVALMLKYNVDWLIEDNCDALGSMYMGNKTGAFGHLATQSFYPAHHINTGEGGAVLTSDPKLLMILRSFNEWGRDCFCNPGYDNTCGKRFGWKLGNLPEGYDHKYTYSHLGYNFKMTQMQAALGLGQMEEIDKFSLYRRSNHALLENRFAEFGEFLVYQENEYLSDPSWFGFGLRLTEKAKQYFTRKQLIDKLEGRGIATRLLFGGNLLKQPGYTDFKIQYVSYGLPNTTLLMNDAFWIGCFPGIDDEHINYAVQNFREVLKELTQ